MEVIVEEVLKMRLFKRCGSTSNQEGGQPNQAGGRKIRRNYRHRHNPLTYVTLKSICIARHACAEALNSVSTLHDRSLRVAA